MRRTAPTASPSRCSTPTMAARGRDRDDRHGREGGRLAQRDGALRGFLSVLFRLGGQLRPMTREPHVTRFARATSLRSRRWRSTTASRCTRPRSPRRRRSCTGTARRSNACTRSAACVPSGVPVFFTIDAGPQVKAVCAPRGEIAASRLRCATCPGCSTADEPARARRGAALSVAQARAPGKLVALGEYAVLDGAPALVLAIDRYAVARSSRAATRMPSARREAEQPDGVVRAGRFERLQAARHS